MRNPTAPLENYVKRRAALVLLALFLAAGCVRSSSDTVRPMPRELAARSHVSDIVLTSLPANVSPEFGPKLSAALRDHLSKCARGEHPLRLEAAVALFSPQIPALTILAGDSNKIKGTARLVEPASGEVVGDYDIARSIGWGGIAAAAIMAPAEAEMTDAFAAELCERAFARGR
jgi:hypothetical protein